MSFIAIILAYLLGTIPFGLLLTRAAGLGDVRKIGSGNIGATNVLRTGNKKLALLTLLLDAAKGFVAVWLARHMAPDAVPLAALAVILGHVFPVWLRFKGGKGVATAFGVYLALAPSVAGLLAAIWLGCFIVTRYVSLASMISLGLAPVILSGVLPLDFSTTIVSMLISILIVWKHKDNISRLLNGTEHRFGKTP